jgi:hypothetical protein
LFQPVTIGNVHPVKFLELVQQLLRRSRIVTVTFPLGDDLALVGNMPLGFGNVPSSQRQMVQYQGSVWHTSSNARHVRPFRAWGSPAGVDSEDGRELYDGQNSETRGVIAVATRRTFALSVSCRGKRGSSTVSATHQTV